MSIIDDLKSGRCAIYGQFSALLAFVCLVIFGFFNLISTLIIFSILGWVFAGLIFLIEVPFCASCCANENLQRVSRFFQANQFKAILYLVLSIIMWLSTRVATSSLIVSALLLTLTTAFYGIAALRKEDPAKSTLNSASTAVQASSTFGGRV
ncbi:Golgi apparatus membrane protein tvp18 [Polyrhizophydium stewartii]|uniref:Golgi apparatus membrane protein tvp18 n=1 Tax=Polyrhizophydium stewartii TaxID=2732419 RepID=A0ABR4MX52_9FUNG